MYLRLLLFIGLLAACKSPQQVAVSPAAEVPVSKPQALKEFRAAWVATVANINWPSKPGLSTAEQQAEALQLLDFLKNHHYNAVVFQVRPQADALYQSALEPWSYYLTGEQGKAPSPYYDPLQFWIDHAHDRGLELHVWLNPYRAHHVAGGPLTETSIARKKPELVHALKQGYWWFDPALKGTQDHSAAVVLDLVKRYDLDGVHFDDYFYPYPEYNQGADFPDSASYAAYTQSGGKLARGDWRRDAVNKFIERCYREIKATKPNVKFGLSPFGIWRPYNPLSVEGFDQYDVLYADAKLWLNKGWIDYFSPQLYWPTNRIPLSFPVLLGWWQNENTHQRHLWPGISIAKDTQEVKSQIMIARGIVPKSPGVVHWSISSVTRNPDMGKALIEGPYKQEALAPASPWLDNTPPAAPAAQVSRQADSVRVSWQPADEADAFRFVVYTKYGKKWSYQLRNRNDRDIAVAAQLGTQALSAVMVKTVDRMGNESAASELKVP